MKAYMRGMDLANVKKRKDETNIELRKNIREDHYMKRRNLYSSDPYQTF